MVVAGLSLARAAVPHMLMLLYRFMSVMLTLDGLTCSRDHPIYSLLYGFSVYDLHDFVEAILKIHGYPSVQ